MAEVRHRKANITSDFDKDRHFAGSDSVSDMADECQNQDNALNAKTSASADDSSKISHNGKHNESSVWTQLAQRLLTGTILFALLTRFYRIHEPAQVVFDEVHFGGFASNYLRREFYFDVHPPLGKMLVAGIAYLAGFDGSFRFSNIGLNFSEGNVPFIAMRLGLASFGIASVVLAFSTLIEMGVSPVCAGLAAVMLVFDNALVTQSRFILLDSMLFAFIMASLYSWVKFRQQRNKPFGLAWWGYLAATGAAIGCATGVKLVGLFSVATIGILTLTDLYDLSAAKKNLSDKMIHKHFMARALCLIVLPVAIYIAAFYVHFAILTKTGPGDAFMSPQFQATLEGNSMHTSSRGVYYGQSLRIKNKAEDIMLHSHEHNYPLVHVDGKVSSQGQQVTGYPIEDQNNIWKVIPADDSALEANERRPVANGDKIRLLHVATQKQLFTHDVASPLTFTNQEVIAVPESDKDRFANAVWQLEIKTGGDKLRTKAVHFRLKHAVTNVFLCNHQQSLPEWGFGQREINGDKRGVGENMVWSVFDVIDPLDEADLAEKDNRPKPTMSFVEKFIEYQAIAINTNSRLIDNHPFKSHPSSWPFVTRGISFWDSSKEARIYLLGNIVAWYMALGGLYLCFAMGVREWYQKHRGRPTNDQDRHLTRFIERSLFILVAWSLHYLPFYVMGRSLYLHHYLPAYMISTMAVAVAADFLMHRQPKVAMYAVLAILAYAVIYTFWYFTPITYGTRVPTEELMSKRWLSSWDWP